MSPLKILLTSSSDIKRIAIQKYFHNIKQDIILDCKSVLSNLPPQPANCGLYCATNRIEFFNSELHNYDFVISIENDITNSQYNNCIMDRANVVIRNSKGINGVATGNSVIIVPTIITTSDNNKGYINNQKPTQPNDNTELIKKLGDLEHYSTNIKGYNNTVGKIFQSFGFCNTNDNWMLTMCGIDRVDQIICALTEAYNSLNYVLDFSNNISQSVTLYPDFPKPGCDFKYFYSLFCNPKHMNQLSDILQQQCYYKEFDVILPLESRGLILGSIMAKSLECSMIPVQKLGKVPGKFITEKFDKEYGTDEVCISCDLITEIINNNPKRILRFLIVDDLIATGGSIQASLKLLAKLSNMYNFKYYAEVLVIDEVVALRNIAKSKLDNTLYTVLV